MPQFHWWMHCPQRPRVAGAHVLELATQLATPTLYSGLTHFPVAQLLFPSNGSRRRRFTTKPGVAQRTPGSRHSRALTPEGSDKSLTGSMDTLLNPAGVLRAREPVPGCAPRPRALMGSDVGHLRRQATQNFPGHKSGCLYDHVNTQFLTAQGKPNGELGIVNTMASQ